MEVGWLRAGRGIHHMKVSGCSSTLTYTKILFLYGYIMSELHHLYPERDEVVAGAPPPPSVQVPRWMALRLGPIPPDWRASLRGDSDIEVFLVKTGLRGRVRGFQPSPDREDEAMIHCFQFDPTATDTPRTMKNLQDGWSLPLTVGSHTMYVSALRQVPAEQLYELYAKWYELEVKYTVLSKCYQDTQTQLAARVGSGAPDPKLAHELMYLRQWQKLAANYFPQDRVNEILVALNQAIQSLQMGTGTEVPPQLI